MVDTARLRGFLQLFVMMILLSLVAVIVRGQMQQIEIVGAVVQPVETVQVVQQPVQVVQQPMQQPNQQQVQQAQNSPQPELYEQPVEVVYQGGEAREEERDPNEFSEEFSEYPNGRPEQFPEETPENVQNYEQEYNQEYEREYNAVSTTNSVIRTRINAKQSMETSNPLLDELGITQEEMKIIYEKFSEHMDVEALQKQLEEYNKQGRLAEGIRKLSKENTAEYTRAIISLGREDPKLLAKISKIKDADPAMLQREAKKFRQSMRLGDMFIDEGIQTEAMKIGNVLFQKENGRLKAVLPKELKGKKGFRVKLNDAAGQEIAELVTLVEQTGQVKRMQLISKEREVKLRSTANIVQSLKAHVKVDLAKLDKDSGLDIELKEGLDTSIAKRFDNLAKKNKIILKDRAAVLDVAKFNLKNKEHINKANIVFKVDKAWAALGGKENVRVLRYDEGRTEVLPTKYVGEEQGLAVFEANSANGLSTFAVFMTESINPTQDTGFNWGKIKTMILPVLIIVTVGAAFVSSFFVRPKEGKGK